MLNKQNSFFLKIYNNNNNNNNNNKNNKQTNKSSKTTDAVNSSRFTVEQ